MKQAKTSNYKRIFTAYFIAVGSLIVLGLAISFKSTGEIFSKAAFMIGNTSLGKTTFSEAMTKSLRVHLIYVVFVLLFSGTPASIILSTVFAGFKAFSVGALVGLAVRYCTFKKAFTICFCSFISNVSVFPLYAVLFVMNLKYNSQVYIGNSGFHYMLKDYFSYACRVLVVFALLCIADGIQNALGLFAVSLLG